MTIDNNFTSVIRAQKWLQETELPELDPAAPVPFVEDKPKWSQEPVYQDIPDEGVRFWPARWGSSSKYAESLSLLCDRYGWTKAAIKKFLGSPSCFVKNPHYRSKAPCRMYAQSRVELVEKSAEWREWCRGYYRRTKKLPYIRADALKA